MSGAWGAADHQGMRTSSVPTRALTAWAATVFAAGLLAAATSEVGGPEESVAIAASTPGDPRPSTTGAPTTTATTAATTTTTAAPVVETTVPPTTAPATTAPPTTAPPVTEPPTTLPPDPSAVPPPPGFAVSFGPEIYEPTGSPYIHMRGTGCTGPGHTNGVPYTYPFEYGVSYLFTTTQGEYVIRMDPEHSQPGTGDWTLSIPPINGAGDFLVAVTCVDASSELQPWGSNPSWTAAVLEYPAQRVTVPG